MCRTETLETALVLASQDCMTGFEVSRWEELETRQRFPSPGETLRPERAPVIRSPWAPRFP